MGNHLTNLSKLSNEYQMYRFARYKSPLINTQHHRLNFIPNVEHPQLINETKENIWLGENQLNKRRLFLLSSSVVCIIIITAGLLHWAYEQWAEQKLQGYIERLEKRGLYVEEQSLSYFSVDNLVTIGKFSDFAFGIDFEYIAHIYFDRRIHALYFLSSIQGDGTKAIIFHYKWRL